MDYLEELGSKKYISLETYRKSGEAVQTPVWFFVRDGQVYVVTRSKTGKVRRLRNITKVRIAECGINGRIIGRWIPGVATILDAPQTRDAVRLRDKKYGLAARFAKFFTASKGDFVAISIRPD